MGMAWHGMAPQTASWIALSPPKAVRLRSPGIPTHNSPISADPPSQTYRGGSKLCLKGLKVSPLRVDAVGKLASGGAAAATASRSKVGPENRVVDVAAAIELNRSLEGNLLGDIVARLCGLELLHRRVQVGHVRVVVLAVVDLHDLAADVRLQRRVLVRQVWERELCRRRRRSRRECTAGTEGRAGETGGAGEHDGLGCW